MSDHIPPDQFDAPETQRDPYGPSDSSDSASDLPSTTPDTDASGTGERPSVEPPYTDPERDQAPDLKPDRQVDAEDAGLSWEPPDRARNGGLPRDSDPEDA